MSNILFQTCINFTVKNVNIAPFPCISYIHFVHGKVWSDFSCIILWWCYQISYHYDHRGPL